MEVVHFHRKQRATGNFSVETYYKAIRELSPADITITPSVCRYESRGFFKRFYNSVEASARQKDVNHVTGDVHFLTLFFKRSKAILTVLDCGMLKNVSGIKFLVFRLFWFTLPAMRSRFITVISEATKKDLLNYIDFPEEHIRVIYVCISSAFKRSPKPFNKQQPVILQIGTAANKNLARLIPALEGISCKLVIIGRIGQDIRELLNKHQLIFDNIDKAISEEEIISHYEDCDIVSFVSLLEGFGMPIVEANTVGRVVITGNTSSMPEIAGNAAHIVDSYDIAAIRNGIIRLIEDDVYREQLVQNGFENCKRFAKETIAEQHYELYREVVALNS